MVFADDSGLCVDALGGAPGVFSARFAGPGATDDDNNRKLLAELRRVESQRQDKIRDAHYECVIVLALRDNVLGIFEGSVHGLIIDSPRGSGGFGYDPYFYFPPLNGTFAELTPEEKFAVSHRGIAFLKALKYLELSPARTG